METNSILGCITSSTAGILKAALVTPHLEYGIWFGDLQYNSAINKLEQVQWRFTAMIGVWNTCCVRRGWGWWTCSAWRSVGFRERNGNPPLSLTMLQRTQSSTSQHCGKMRDIRHKLDQVLHLDTRKSLFTLGLTSSDRGCTGMWRLHPWMILGPNWTKSCVAQLLWPADVSLRWSFDYRPPEVPSNLNGFLTFHFIICCFKSP